MKVGIVGAGDIGRAHANAFAAQHGIQVAIARGTNPSRADQLAADVGCEVALDFAALLSDPAVAGVVICVPNDLHVDYVCQAAAAGKHVLCEKPIALTLDDAHRAASCASAAGVSLAVGHCLRFWDVYRTARDVVRSGRLGRLLSLSCRRALPLLRTVRGAFDWRHDGSRSGGAVIDLQVHDLDFIRWTLGPEVALSSSGLRSASGTFDHVFSMLRFADDVVATIESSFLMPVGPVVMELRAIGESAVLEFKYQDTNFSIHTAVSGTANDVLEAGHPGALLLRVPDKAPEVLVPSQNDPIGEMFERQAAAFVRLIQGERVPDLASASEAEQALASALASKDSCESGSIWTES
jgi:UDP-N-acetylglucosamine 3-dehydrogenase